MSPRSAFRIADVSYASRESYWRTTTDSLCGPGASSVLHALANQAVGSRTLAVSMGSPQVGAGQIAAALVLHRICCSNDVRLPPVQIVVVPDRVAPRHGYLAFEISAADVRGLLNAWRVRAVAAGKSPGDLTTVERALVRRSKRIAPSQEAASPNENLHLFFPAYRAAEDGTLAAVAARNHLPADLCVPALTFLDGLNVLPALRRWSINPDWVIVDCTVAGLNFDPTQIVDWAQRYPEARHLSVVPGLAHPLVDQLRGRGFRICWLRDDAGGDSVALPEPHAQITWLPVESGVGQEDLHRLLAVLIDARRDVQSSGGQVEWAAFGTLRTAILTISALPVPRRFYDGAARDSYGIKTTDELLQSLKEHELRVTVSRPILAAALEEARSILQHSAAHLDAGNERTSRTLAAVERAIAGDRGICVVVRNRTVRAAVEAYLADELNTNLSDLIATGVRIESRRDLRPSTVPDRMPMLWTSYSGLVDLDRALAFTKHSISLFVNWLEREMLAHDVRTWCNRATAAQDGTQRLGVTFPGNHRFASTVFAIGANLRSTESGALGSTQSDQIARLLDDPLPSVATAYSGTAPETSVVRPALAITFESGSVSYFPEHSVVTIMRGDEDHPLDVAVTELRSGDRLVFVDKAIGRTIYELMQEQLTQSPLVGAAAEMVRLWHRAISAAHTRCGLRVSDILRDLQRRGSSIKTSQTIRYWLRGGVLGPRDTDDVDRLAAVLAIGQREPSLLREIKMSVRNLRNVYRQFAKIVYRTVLTGGTGRRLSVSEERLLETHGISLADLRSAITTETVLTVATRPEMQSAYRIGRIGSD